MSVLPACGPLTCSSKPRIQVSSWLTLNTKRNSGKTNLEMEKWGAAVSSMTWVTSPVASIMHDTARNTNVKYLSPYLQQPIMRSEKSREENQTKWRQTSLPLMPENHYWIALFVSVYKTSSLKTTTMFFSKLQLIGTILGTIIVPFISSGQGNVQLMGCFLTSTAGTGL